jgi:hypothetical protein
MGRIYMPESYEKTRISDMYLDQFIQDDSNIHRLYNRFGRVTNEAVFKYYAVKLFKRSKEQASEIHTRIENAKSLLNRMDYMTMLYQINVILNKRTLDVARVIADTDAHTAMEDGKYVLYTKLRTCPDDVPLDGLMAVSKVVSEIRKGLFVGWESVQEQNPYRLEAPQTAFDQLLDIGDDLDEAKRKIFNNPIGYTTLVRAVKAEISAQKKAATKPQQSKKPAKAIEHKK